MRYWLLKPAEQLIRNPMGQIAGLALMLSYFEGVWIYVQGQDSKGRSKQFFREGFLDSFRRTGQSEKLLERVADVLYEDARCGFFHDAMSRGRIYIGNHFPGPLTVTLPKIGGVIDQTGIIESIVVHPPEFFQFIEGHLRDYVQRLRDVAEAELRGKFERACKVEWDFEGTSPVIAL
jgi:hypothetical protein